MNDKIQISYLVDILETMNDKIPTSSKSKIANFILINQEEFIDYFNLILDFEISCKPSLSRNSSYFVM
jgi:hypothetical protein